MTAVHKATDTSAAEEFGPALLAKLHEVHREVLVCVQVLEDATAAAVPDVVQLTGARFKISQAGLAKRQIWQRIRSHLASRVSVADAQILHQFAERYSVQSSHSTAHIARWSTAAVIEDWAAYQDASREMRSRIVEGVQSDQALLYSLLQRYR